LETRKHRHRPLWQLAGKHGGLEPKPQPVLGYALPIWRTEDGKEEKCIGSIEELNAEIRKANEVLGGDVNTHYLHDGILDLHKPYVDEVVLVSDAANPCAVSQT
jgi:hypothetical protein